MKKILYGLCVLCLLCSCTKQEPITPIDKTLKEKMIGMNAMEYGAWIEHYRTSYPKDKDQEIIADTQTNTPFKRNEVGAQKIVFHGFENPELEQLNETFAQLYDESIQKVEYNTKNENLIQKCKTINFEIYENEEIISIIQTIGLIEDGKSVSSYSYKIWNLDKDNGNLLNNDELISDTKAFEEAVKSELETDDFELNDETLLYQNENQWRVKIQIAASQNAIDVSVVL